jgi:hypothetical protein
MGEAASPLAAHRSSLIAHREEGGLTPATVDAKLHPCNPTKGRPVVLTAPVGTIDHRAAATAAAWIHLHYEGSVLESPLSDATGIDDLAGMAIVAQRQGLIEWFPHEEQALDALAAPARAAAADGWTVGVVVPGIRMGEAHRDLRGAPVVLQPWWADGETVRFGGPEVP